MDEGQKLEFFRSAFASLSSGGSVELGDLVTFFGEAANAEGAIDELFRQIDRNENGFIEEGELTAYLDEL